MPTQPLAGFMHRRNPDGTHDAICLNCYALVAIKWIPSDLLQAEKQHVCGATACDVVGLASRAILA